MLSIPCPYCGERNSDEFRYGGDAGVTRPAHDDASEDAWFRYVYIRANPKGEHREYWQHAAGCRGWLIVTRLTTDHRVLKVEPARQEQLR